MSIVKIKMLVLYDILCRYTDEDHALHTDEIIKLLEEKGIMVDDILDKYGEDVRIWNREDGTLRVKVPVQVSKTFFAWVVGSQGKVKLLSPKPIIDEFKTFVAKIKEEY